MKKNSAGKNNMAALASLLLFAVFSICAVSSLLFGVESYRNVVKTADEVYETRTPAQYVLTKLRQANAPDAIGYESFADGDMLVISENIDGEEFATKIYVSDGSMYEMFAEKSMEFLPGEGEKMFDMGEMTVSEADGLLTIGLETLDGEADNIFFEMKNKEGDYEK